jgi:DNA-directed RNA polymerase specialized sigma24 family protein
MTAKEELLQYKYAREKVDETLEEYQKYKDRAEKMTSIISDMPRGTSSSDKIADNAVKMADLSAEYEKRWLEAENKKLEIEKNIDLVEEPYRILLHKRYVEGKTLEEISTLMNYSFDRVRHMHGEALLKYEKLAHFSTQKHI